MEGLTLAPQAEFDVSDVQLVVVPVDYGENIRVPVEELGRDVG